MHTNPNHIGRVRHNERERSVRRAIATLSPRQQRVRSMATTVTGGMALEGAAPSNEGMRTPGA